MDLPDIETLKLALLASLAFSCQQGEPNGCLLVEKRKLLLSDKFSWVLSLSDDEIHKLYSAHCGCLKTKTYLEV